MATLFRYKRDFKTPVRGYGSSQILFPEADSHSTIIQVNQYKCKNLTIAFERKKESELKKK